MNKSWYETLYGERGLIGDWMLFSTGLCLVSVSHSASV